MLYSWSYFDDWINNALESIEKEFSPKWKRDDDRGGWKISFLLPGIEKEKVEVTSGKGWSKVKHPNGSLKISLPRDADHEKISAKLDLGIFELFAPDMEPAEERKIKVQ